MCQNFPSNLRCFLTKWQNSESKDSKANRQFTNLTCSLPTSYLRRHLSTTATPGALQQRQVLVVLGGDETAERPRGDRRFPRCKQRLLGREHLGRREPSEPEQTEVQAAERGDQQVGAADGEDTVQRTIDRAE